MQEVKISPLLAHNQLLKHQLKPHHHNSNSKEEERKAKVLQREPQLLLVEQLLVQDRFKARRR